MSGFPDLAACHFFGPVNKSLVKGEEGIVPVTCHKVHGIGEVEPRFVHPENPAHIFRAVHMNIWETQKFDKSRPDIVRFEFVSKTEHPLGFQNDRIGDEDLFMGANLFGFQKLLFIIPG